MSAKVLVSQGWFKHSLGMVRHLAKQGYEMYALGEPGTEPLVSHSKACKGVFPVPQKEEVPFVEGLLNVLEKNPMDVFIPVGFPVTRFTCLHEESIGELTRLAIPTAHQEQMAGDKFVSNLLAIRTGVGAPKTIRISSMDELEPAGKELGFPLILKGARETGLGIVAKAESLESLRQTYEDLMERFGLTRPEDWPLLQEFIPGWGCGFFAIYDKGECKRVFMHRRVREYPATGGASCCAESFRDPELERSGRALLNELKWHGVAMVEFRFDERDKQFKLIEINPKFWGSLELALAVGADFAGDYVRLAQGEELQFTDQFKNIRFQWPLDGDFQHARAVPSRALAVLGDFLNPAVANNIPWDEPALIKKRLAR